MNWYKRIKIATSRTLYHGSSIDKYNSIKDIGLIPMVGDFVSDMYAGEYESVGIDFDPTPLTFAADKGSVNKAVTAMMYSVSKLLNKEMYQLSLAEIKQYGMIVIIKEGEEYFEKRPEEETGPWRDWQGETNSRYPAVEPGDYFSEDNQGISHILTGNKMVNFLYKMGEWPPYFNKNNIEELRKQLLTLAIRYHVRKKPGMKNHIIKDITNRVKNLTEQEIKNYLKDYKERVNYELV